MKLRDGLLLAPVLLIGVMVAAIALLPWRLANIVLCSVAGLSGLSLGSFAVLSLTAQRGRSCAGEAPPPPSRRSDAERSAD